VGNQNKKETLMCTTAEYRKCSENSEEKDYFLLGWLGGAGEEAEGKVSRQHRGRGR
jgi:hypothetical protein